MFGKSGKYSIYRNVFIYIGESGILWFYFICRPLFGGAAKNGGVYKRIPIIPIYNNTYIPDIKICLKYGKKFV